MKEGHGKRFSRGCRRWSAYGVRSSRTRLPVYGQRCPRLRPCHHIKRNLCREARRVDRRGDPCRSLFTFRVLCANSPLDRVQSRSSTRPQLWPTRCRLFGHSTRASAIASQRSKDKCGNISISSLGTKISDIQVDSRVPSQPDLIFQSSPPSVVAERITVMCNQSQPGLSARMNVQPITNALKAALDKSPSPATGQFQLTVPASVFDPCNNHL